MKTFFCFALIFSLNVNAAEPTLIPSNLIEKLKSSIPPPPAAKSEQQKEDESTLINLQGTRNAAECARAKLEASISLANFFESPRGTLSKSEVEKLTSFFETIRNDADYYIQKLKTDFPRMRPYAYIKGIKPCIPHELTASFPSEHAAIAKLFALVLGDLYPKKGATFLKRSQQISTDRILAGIDHPSDTESGRKLGELIYVELKVSKKYLDSFELYKKAVDAAITTPTEDKK